MDVLRSAWRFTGAYVLTWLIIWVTLIGVLGVAPSTRQIDYQSVEKVGNFYFGSTNCKTTVSPPEKDGSHWHWKICDWVRLTPAEVKKYQKSKDGGKVR